ncbi:10949_t:CDS:1, partial [Paraglomus occultum]
MYLPSNAMPMEEIHIQRQIKCWDVYQIPEIKRALSSVTFKRQICVM